ncbi:uncharacterized protein LOC132198046 [Neocloeon triangulifer]|uniref:uncharacterized protein LOC132198046 n=1 Tax=Neocloeon triangulifer TaxID=2078957 RepID=UPI00286F3F25|nr:uncharacterized protein LOC132198046 [Neocloeon triangulifer]
MAPGQHLVDDTGAWAAPGVILGSGGSDRFLQLAVTPRTYNAFDDDDGGGIHMPSEYDRFMADVWVGVVLTLMVFSCLCCMCSCMLYHRFQEWKRGVLAAAAAREGGENGPLPEEALPNYTLVSGLPSYDEALQQWRAARVHRKSSVSKMAEAIQVAAAKTPPPAPLRRLSVLEFLLNYKGQKTVPSVVNRHIADV